MTNHPPLTMDDYAVVLAYLTHFPGKHHADVLLRLDVDEREWEEADKRWREAMIQDLLVESHTVSDAFNDAFVPVKRRLKKETPELVSLTPLRLPLAATPPLVTIADPPVLRAIAPEAAVFAQSATLAAPVASRPLEVPSFVSWPVAFAPPPIVGEKPPVNPRSPSVEAASASPTHRNDLVPVGMRHFTSLAGTQLAPDAPSTTPTLPFVRAAPPAPPKPQTPVSLVPEGMRRFTGITGTQGAIDVPSGPSLPFGLRPAVATVESPMSLEEYTRLHVELALAPANRREIVQRYGIDEPKLSRLDAYWGPRIKTDAAMRAVWDSIYAAHRARLARNEGPPR